MAQPNFNNNNNKNKLLLAIILELLIAVSWSEIYPEERNALLLFRDGLKSEANLHSKWTGPICSKANTSRWPGIACTDWHVTRIVLQGIQLTGSIPAFLQNITLLTKLDLRNNSIQGPLPDLSGLDGLEFVFLSQNQFSGSIPWAYIALPNLRKLELDRNRLQGSIPPFDQQSLIAFNVSDNELEGEIPETSALQRFTESSFDGNPNLCGKPLITPCRIPPPPPRRSPPPPPVERKSKGLEVWSISLIVAAAALVSLTIMIVLFCCCCNRKAHRKQKENVQKDETEKRTSPWSRGHQRDPERRVELQFFNNQTISVFDLDDLLRASAEVIGKGKISTTYKATLESGNVVAVKRLRNIHSLPTKEFTQHMQLLGNLRHQNIVQIVTFYYSKDEKMVIYEYVNHGSLHDLLHENRGIGRVPINWRVRLSIVKDIARGLTYLHQSLLTLKVPHGNLRSSNVLIQRDTYQTYQSKLTDYGFMLLLPSRDSSAKLAVARSPEFCHGKRLSSKSDVYSFGIILLEVITGKIPGDLLSPENSDDDLSDWVKTVVNNDWSTDILDMEILAEKEGYNEMLKLTDLALLCTDALPEKRPKMEEVLRRIEEIEVEGQSTSMQ